MNNLRSAKISFLFPIMAFLVITVFSFMFLTGRPYLDTEGANLTSIKRADILTLPKNSDITLEQEINASQDKLAQLSFPLGLSQTTLELELRIQDTATNHTIRQTTISLTNADQPNIKTIDWEFEPIISSENKTYPVTISWQTGTKPMALFTVSPERHDGGNFSINSQLEQDKKMVIDWQYQNKNQLQTILQRLSLGKPGIFGSPIIMAVSLVIMVLLISGTVGILAQYYLILKK